MIDLISVIVPVGRVDGHLREQLDALHRQSVPCPTEFVLACNTKSSDGQVELRAAVDDLEDDRFSVVPATERRGAAYARNVGAGAAQGVALAFCDGDDIVHDGWLIALVESMTGHDAVGGRLVESGMTDRQRSARPAMTPDALPEFLGVPYMGSGNMMIMREAFEEVGGFDEGLIRCEDIALSWKLVAAGRRIGFASDARVTYRHRDGVVAMLQQHVAYGRGMGQVLVRYGIPSEQGWARPRGVALMRPNTQPRGASSGRKPARLRTPDRARGRQGRRCRRGDVAREKVGAALSSAEPRESGAVDFARLTIGEFAGVVYVVLYLIVKTRAIRAVAADAGSRGIAVAAAGRARCVGRRSD